ncbi:hypothetical protein HGA88_06575 [Candidatus Roizmanbacteria bacterium]|nr:hypothetical protein [Candidatus Roizmanbacteria bacterium]
MNNSKILLVEGIAGIGKSTIIDLLIRKHIQEAEQRKIRTFLHLTQAHTYGPLAPDEDSNSLTRSANLLHLDKITSFLSWMAQSVEKEKILKFFCIIDTLHLTHCVRPGILDWKDVLPTDSLLAKLGTKLIFVKAQPKTILERTIELRKDNQFITHYGKRFGSNLEEIHQYFVGEQLKMARLFAASGLQKIELNAEKTAEENTDIVYDFWKK